ncbi:hypothetical protein CWB73_12125 [Pseudoalteromonas phenolica]|uniref:Uncharacterized protein n=1 Tax=Pseudoalteromonas phenolica TaxID=161398 RepID=A0A5S3YSA6_9GAMM|nr:hypothetical protein CWB73_12125 [Pseudoalteromonas phenolica]
MTRLSRNDVVEIGVLTVTLNLFQGLKLTDRFRNKFGMTRWSRNDVDEVGALSVTLNLFQGLKP